MNLLLSILFLSFAEAAVIKNLKGDVQVNSKKATEGMTVKSKDIVLANGKTSSVQIFFEDGSRSLLRNGELSIEEATSETPRTLINLARGILFSSKEKSKTNLELKTKLATMGIRGTKFYVQEDGSQTYLCVCEGKVEIKNETSTIMVEKNEDAKVASSAKFEKSKANNMMVDMANEGFIEMGLIQK